MKNNNWEDTGEKRTCGNEKFEKMYCIIGWGDLTLFSNFETYT